MHASFKAKNPEDIEFTLRITMTLKEWNNLSKHVGYSENWSIAHAISEMKIKAYQCFYPDTKEAEQPQQGGIDGEF